MDDPVSKSVAKRHVLEGRVHDGAIVTCWFTGEVCPNCMAALMATDGTRTWCASEVCLPIERES